MHRDKGWWYWRSCSCVVHIIKRCHDSQIVEEIKRNSSRWIKNFDPVYYRFFAWQGGYAAYSISQSVVDKTLQYIDNQKEHHARHSFAEEYKAFLDLYKVEYDEKFVFRD